MLSVIIVDYNSIDRTIDYIFELESQLLINCTLHIIIVDVYTNMVVSVSKLTQKFGQGEEKSLLEKKIVQFNHKCVDIVYVFAEDNLGYARGNNLGAYISNSLFNDDFLLISNNDLVLLNPLPFSKIESIFTADEQIGVVGVRVVGKDGRSQSPCKYISPFLGLFFRYWLSLGLSHFVHSDMDLDYTNNSKYCYRVMGCFMFIRKKAFEDVNGFDNNTFLYYEESILSERMIKKGYTTYFYNDYTVLHNHGETTGKIENQLLIYKYGFNAGIYYYKQYRQLSPFLVTCSKMNFALFQVLHLVKTYIKKAIKKDGKY